MNKNVYINNILKMNTLNEEQLSLLKSFFEQDSSLLYKQFKTILITNDMFQGLSDENFELLYKNLDLNKDGKFEFKEFMKNLMADTIDEPEPERCSSG